MMTIEDAGFDKYLRRTNYGGGDPRYNSVRNIASGTMSDDTVINVGRYVKIDGKNRRIVVNDGTDDRILIGYDQGGF